MQRYAVKRAGGANHGKQIGTVTASSLTHAFTKALQLFKRHVYVERLT
jgi:hypothetical protein